MAAVLGAVRPSMKNYARQNHSLYEPRTVYRINPTKCGGVAFYEMGRYLEPKRVVNQRLSK